MSDTPVQSALTALMPIKPTHVDFLRQKLIDEPINRSGLDAVGTVHFARIFVFKKDNIQGINSNLAAVITTYDGSFDKYIQDFVNNDDVAAFFDSFLEAVDDEQAKKIIPVAKNSKAFAAFILKYDVTNPATKWGQWYSAYPELTVQNILHP